MFRGPAFNPICCPRMTWVIKLFQRYSLGVYILWVACKTRGIFSGIRINNIHISTTESFILVFSLIYTSFLSYKWSLCEAYFTCLSEFRWGYMSYILCISYLLFVFSLLVLVINIAVVFLKVDFFLFKLLQLIRFWNDSIF